MRKLDESDLTLLRYLSNTLASAPERSEELVETVISTLDEGGSRTGAKNRKSSIFSILNDLKEIVHGSTNVTANELATAALKFESKTFQPYKRAGYILRRALLRQSLRNESKVGVTV